MRAWGHRTGGLGAILALVVLSGCSTYDSMFGSRPAASAPPAPAASSPSLSDRFSNLVLGGPATMTTGQGPGGSGPADLDCPTVEIRQGAGTYSQSAPSNGSEALSTRFQASFARNARQCALRAGTVTMKVGVEGRLILGPSGGPGNYALPVRLALVREGVDPQTIWTKFYMVPVIVPPGQENVLFTQVEDDLSFPMPSANDFDAYVIYVGFDPDSAAPEPKKKAAPKKAKR
jgi:hypothetical protein